MNPLTALIRSLLGLLRETVLPESLRPIALFLEGVVGNLNLPATDERVGIIAVEVASAVDDLLILRNETDEGVLRAGRAAIELRLTRKLDELGLLKGH